jgi:LacI family transcriptional regulator
VAPANYTLEGGESALRELMKASDPPTAVFVANVTSAIGCLKAAYDLGIAVPERLSVVAIHDMPLARFLTPPLTTVTLPLEELGRQGLELLATSPPDAAIEVMIRGAPVLNERGSTAVPGRG